MYYCTLTIINDLTRHVPSTILEINQNLFLFNLFHLQNFSRNRNISKHVFHSYYIHVIVTSKLFPIRVETLTYQLTLSLSTP